MTGRADERKPEARRRLDRHDYVPHYLSLIGSGLISRGSRDYLDRYGVGLNEARIIAVLGRTPGLTPAQLGVAMGMNKSMVSRSLAAMVAQDLVIQTGTPRALQNRLSAAGDALHDKIVTVALAREAQLLEGFTDDEKAVLLGLLRRLLDNVNTIRTPRPRPARPHNQGEDA